MAGASMNLYNIKESILLIKIPKAHNANQFLHKMLQIHDIVNILLK